MILVSNYGYETLIVVIAVKTFPSSLFYAQIYMVFRHDFFVYGRIDFAKVLTIFTFSISWII